MSQKRQINAPIIGNRHKIIKNLGLILFDLDTVYIFFVKKIYTKKIIRIIK